MDQGQIFNFQHSKFDPYDQLNIKLNPDGTITRLLNPPLAPDVNSDPDPDSGQAFLFKDAILDPQKKTSLRIYLSSKLTPKTPASPAQPRFPIVFYFHDASWVQCRANHFGLHLNCGLMACSIPAFLILIDYRLAPEDRLPAQYDDAIDALLWVKKQAVDPDGEPWVKEYGDFSRCFLYGIGCGGNIVYNTALRAMDVELKPLKIDGLIMNQPIFGGKQRTEAELEYATDHILPLPALDLMWELALPKGMDRDHRFCNPLLDPPHNKLKLKFLQRCLVIAFGMNPLIDRQQTFVEMLVKHGVRVEAQFDDIGFHRIELVDAKRAAALDTFIKEFINHCSNTNTNLC